MQFKCVFKHNSAFLRRPIGIMIFAWCLGLASGIALVWIKPLPLCNAFWAALSIPAAPWAVILIAMFPVLLVSIALFTNRYRLLYLIFYVFALSFGYCGALFSQFFGSGAWLFRALILFSSSVSSVLIWYLLLRGRYRSRNTGPEVLIIGFVSLLSSVFYCIAISSEAATVDAL